MQLIRRLWLAILKKWWQITVPIRLRACGVEFGTGTRFYGMPIVDMAPNSSIRLGDRVVLCSDSRFTALGVNHPVVLRTLRPGAEIVIGNDCGVSGGSICAAISVVLGKECLVGANVTMSDTDFHAINPHNRRYNNDPRKVGAASIKIGDNVFIGTGSVVLKGVCLGSNSVIGAASLVNKNVPPNFIAAGCPARAVRSLGEP